MYILQAIVYIHTVWRLERGRTRTVRLAIGNRLKEAREVVLGETMIMTIDSDHDHRQPSGAILTRINFRDPIFTLPHQIITCHLNYYYSLILKGFFQNLLKILVRLEFINKFNLDREFWYFSTLCASLWPGCMSLPSNPLTLSTHRFFPVV